MLGGQTCRRTIRTRWSGVVHVVLSPTQLMTCPLQYNIYCFRKKSKEEQKNEWDRDLAVLNGRCWVLSPILILGSLCSWIKAQMTISYLVSISGSSLDTQTRIRFDKFPDWQVPEIPQFLSTHSLDNTSATLGYAVFHNRDSCSSLMISPWFLRFNITSIVLTWFPSLGHQ